MNQAENSTTFYHKRIAELQQALQQLYKRRRLLGWLRFAILMLLAFVVYTIWQSDTTLIIVVIVAGIALFLFIVSKDTNNKESIENFETLVVISKKEIDYRNGNYFDQYDGKNLEPEHHAYAADLDLCGKASLYQYINRCNAEKARALLAERLLQPLNKEEILAQQEAVKELASKPQWRQQLQAYGEKEKITTRTENRVLEWLRQENKYYAHAFWETFRYVYPLITLSSFGFYLFNIINTTIFSVLVFGFYIFGLSISKNITSTYNLLSKVVPEIDVLYKQMNWFEKETFSSTLMNSLQNTIKHDNIKASDEILNLKNILNRFDVRLNVFAFLILNTFLLWDLHQMMALKKWKAQNKTLVPKWFNAIAEIEVVNTFATLSFNHPEWCYPAIADEHFTLKAEDVGHPLIPEQQRVNNSFGIEGGARVI